jgi:GPH family glycoside/pentoside/hexuronide:cation symporter
MTDRIGWKRSIVFASGDFAFNLYWQSISTYLMFYYTDAVGLAASTAGNILLLASVWDAIADPLIGVTADRTRTRWGRYRPFLLFGAVPLAIGFVLVYFRPPLSGTAMLTVIVAAHLTFRSLYAVANVPYIALTAQITRSSAERGRIAGLRMLFATCAFVLVARTTQPIAQWASGSRDDAGGFLVAAAIFAVIATPILLLIFVTTREKPVETPALDSRGRWSEWRPVLANRAFWTMIASATALVACYIVYAKSVLYYYKYVLHAEAAAPGALAVAGLAGLVIVPAWMIAARHLSKRAIWLANCGIFIVGLIAFALLDLHAGWQMQVFLIWMQGGYLGVNFAYWGMLPDTIEYGEWRTGVRAEGLIFGIALLFQKISIGIGGALFGNALSLVGYDANHAQTPATIAGMRAIMIGLPLAGAAISAMIMLFNPLRRGTHQAILDQLAERAGPTEAVFD